MIHDRCERFMEVFESLQKKEAQNKKYLSLILFKNAKRKRKMKKEMKMI